MNYYFIHYKVKWGDSLESIAKHYNIDLSNIYFVKNEDQFYVGQIILIPVVKNNKTLITTRRTLEFYLKRHLNKRRYYKFYL